MTDRWWGRFACEAGQARYWRLGPLDLWLMRLADEIRLVTRRRAGDDTGPIAAGELTDAAPPAEGDVIRFGVGCSAKEVEIVPVTADRAVIFKSADTYIVPEGGEVTAFLNAPVWLRLQLAEPERFLCEEPTVRPSDTWFGPSTLEGEFCYAARTSVRYRLENVPVLPFRAITVLKIRNEASSALPLARLRVPAPLLSLYANEENRLWTETVTLVRRQEDDYAEVRLGAGPPAEAGPCTRVCRPREEPGRHPLIRSFAGLLGLAASKENDGRLVD